MKQQISQKPVATPAETREALLERAKRDFAPIRRAFVQKKRGEADRSGPLAEFVTNGDLRGLRAYLVIIAATSAETAEGWSTSHSGGVWARAFGTTENATPASARTAVTKVFQRLRERNLITYERVAGSWDIQVTLLREDGSGQPYTRPGNQNRDAYLKIPFELWRTGLFDELSLPALAMLLTASCEPAFFELPTERMKEWYGWSPDTAERGFRELAKTGVIQVYKTYITAPLSPTGTAEVNRYMLLDPFIARPVRKKAASTGGAVEAAGSAEALGL
ncbi:hypothetical protein ACIA8O_38985 [Kitasatospora sp. NPDC051853]|uniref:hypothetical protein n=1 Tax=Kitasatospora sp. NPDC051853 TaxID=3364058 RepID=UPI00379748C2